MKDSQRKAMFAMKAFNKLHNKHGLEIRKDEPHEIYPTQPTNMSKSKWESLYKPQYLVQQTRTVRPDGVVLGMAYYRETTRKKAEASMKYLKRKWENDLFEKYPSHFK